MQVMNLLSSVLLVLLLALDPTLSWTPRLHRKFAVTQKAAGCHRNHLDQISDGETDLCRRDLLIGLGAWSSAVIIPAAQAFPNKISNQYDDRPKRRGPQESPQDLGIAKRTDIMGEEYLGLKSCTFAPNCFSSSITDDPDHSIPPWYFPSTVQDAMTDVYAVLQQYPPGQNGIDGGGFEIKTYDPTNGYIYAQFESLKNGYLDDFEVAHVKNPENALQVRSSSRVGYLDYGVNAKRINFIAKELRKKGWNAEGVDYKTHRFYAAENELKV